tara:strand:+ start:486 stop:614 length:129 start_codon:yes stop_codon:yes gene_type:complete
MINIKLRDKVFKKKLQETVEEEKEIERETDKIISDGFDFLRV